MVTVSIFSSIKQYRDYTTIRIFARLMVKPNRVVMPCMLDNPFLFHLVVAIHQQEEKKTRKNKEHYVFLDEIL
jgi:hypothetical protein